VTREKRWEEEGREWRGGTFDHAQAGAEDGDEGDGAWEDLVGLVVEAEGRLVLWAVG
jgi:hypothetical protein